MIRSSVLVGLLPLLAGPAAVAAPPESVFSAERLGPVTVYAPDGPPAAVVLFVSGDGGWNQGVVDMARHLRDWGALVAGVDIRNYLPVLRTSSVSCIYPAAELEGLSHALQKRAGIRDYQIPVLAGYSSGATLVYAAAAQAPAGTFAGVLSLGFCPELPVSRPWCRGAGLAARSRAKGTGMHFAPAGNMSTPWVVLQGMQDQVCDPAATAAFAARVPGALVVNLPKVGHGYAVEANWLPQFRDAFFKLRTASTAAPAPDGLKDLPVVEIPVTGTVSRRLVVLLTGDGGYAGLDRDLVTELTGAGVPVVALSTLKYFWRERTPDEAARDLGRLIGYYTRAWHRDHVLLVGYSFGANVLPFMVSRLPADTRAMVESMNLLAPATQASFEIHVADWIPGSVPRGMPVLPEFDHLRSMPVLCLYGAEEGDSLCTHLETSRSRALRLPGGHHFSGDAARLAQEVLKFAGEQPK